MGLFSLFTGNNGFAEAVKKGTEDENTVIIDVRTPAEYSGGHVPGSINIPVEKINTTNVDMDKHIMVYCASGARSSRACSLLREKGYDAENIGGIAGYKGPFEN